MTTKGNKGGTSGAIYIAYILMLENAGGAVDRRLDLMTDFATAIYGVIVIEHKEDTKLIKEEIQALMDMRKKYNPNVDGDRAAYYSNDKASVTNDMTLHLMNLMELVSKHKLIDSRGLDHGELDGFGSVEKI